MHLRLIFIISALLFLYPSEAQTFNSFLGDESILYAQTKQVNQFFRRFNGEESSRGDRFYPGEPDYRNKDLRRKYIPVLFDRQNAALRETMINGFANEVIDGQNPFFLDFHATSWFSEVTTTFIYQGREVPVKLFLKLEKERLGSKWVLSNVYFSQFQSIFSMAPDGQDRFLHPMSHEIDFMNLVRVFKDKQHVGAYTSQEYTPDYLTLFLYEFKKGTLTFKTVNDVKFHFFQVPGWYFEVSNFNRSGGNAGWLISNLVAVKDAEKDVMLKYIYHVSK